MKAWFDASGMMSSRKDGVRFTDYIEARFGIGHSTISEAVRVIDNSAPRPAQPAIPDFARCWQQGPTRITNHGPSYGLVFSDHNPDRRRRRDQAAAPLHQDRAFARARPSADPRSRPRPPGPGPRLARASRLKPAPMRRPAAGACGGLPPGPGRRTHGQLRGRLRYRRLGIVGAVAPPPSR